MAKGSRGGRRTHSATTNVQPTNIHPMSNAPITFGRFDDNDAQITPKGIEYLFTHPMMKQAKEI